MTIKRKKHSAKFKFRVALESAKGQKTVGQLAQEFEIHPSQIQAWKKRLREEGAMLFEQKSQTQKQESQQQEVSELYEQIGRLKMELEWLKKRSVLFD